MILQGSNEKISFKDIVLILTFSTVLFLLMVFSFYLMKIYHKTII